MRKADRFKNAPHSELMKQDGEVIIPSIFMLQGGCPELYSMLAVAGSYNCTIVFENENLIVRPKGDALQSMTLIQYAGILENPQCVGDYINYLVNHSSMKWDNAVSRSSSTDR